MNTAVRFLVGPDGHVKPVLDGADLIYRYKIISGTMPANGGPTALFIDWIGVGGGGGRGFHGVGVGYRGRGVY